MSQIKHEERHHLFKIYPKYLHCRLVTSFEAGSHQGVEPAFQKTAHTPMRINGELPGYKSGPCASFICDTKSFNLNLRK